MASIPSSIDMDGHASDHSWHYDCLGSKKGEKQGIAEENANYPKTGLQKEINHTICSPCRVSKDDADEDAECLASIFSVLDENGYGKISADEVMAFMERLSFQMSKEEVELAIRSAFACGDKFPTAMEFPEFYKMIFRKEEVDVDRAISAAFGVFEQNGDGLISAMELLDVLCRLGLMKRKDVIRYQRMIQSVDSNGDCGYSRTNTIYPPSH